MRIHIPTVLESRLQGRASAGFFLLYTSYIVPLQEPPAPPPTPPLPLLVAAALHMWPGSDRRAQRDVWQQQDGRWAGPLTPSVCVGVEGWRNGGSHSSPLCPSDIRCSRPNDGLTAEVECNSGFDAPCWCGLRKSPSNRSASSARAETSEMEDLARRTYRNR